MPEPQSRTGSAITGSNFASPFETPLWPFGMGGLNLAVALDQIPAGQFARLDNLTWIPGEVRSATARPGLTFLAATLPMNEVHSIVRMNDVEAGATTLYWGVSSSLYRGTSGFLSVVDTGYSGDPLTLLPYRPPLSSDPWLFVADRARMRQVRYDGLATGIGQPPPSVAASASAQPLVKTQIANFSSDGTGAASWTINPGFTYSDPPEQLPPGEVILTGFPPSSTPAIQFGIFAMDADDFLDQGGYGFFGAAITRNLSIIGARPATDDDIIHLWLYMTHADLIPEFRLYFVCSEVFSASVLPGQPNEDGANGDFYVKSFSANDFAGFLSAALTQTEAAELARVRDVRDQNLFNRRFRPRQGNPSATTQATLAARDPARAVSIAAGPASETWQELGILGLPIRRGDFSRQGNTSGRDWSTITGIVCFVRSGPGAGTVGVGISDLYLAGGNGPDTVNPDAVPYDYRYTHYHTLTGDEGNPSPEMAESSWVDAVRQAINVTPIARGDSLVRQRFYRRGGTRLTDWDFIGQNTADGQVFVDRVTDAEAAGGGTLETDHYQPVPTVDDAGNTILAQPVPVLFGPYQGSLFALGDPHRPGYVYACKPGESGNWPPDLAFEVSSPSEPLMNGTLYGGQPIVFSTTRAFTLYVNNGQINAAPPTGCKQGLAGRWALTTGMGAIWAVSTQSVFRTAGGVDETISQKIAPLFRGQTVNGYAPIKFTTETARNALRLAIWQDELYFSYQGTNDQFYTLVYQILTGEWRRYVWGLPLSACYADVETQGTNQLLWGGRVSGGGYRMAGTADMNLPIPVVARTGAWDFTRPREEKLLGDQILNVIGNDVTITLQNFLNSESVTNPAQTLVATGSVVRRAIFDSFGETPDGPQKARTVSTELSWSTAGAPPVLFYLGTSISLQPDLTINRVTVWDDLGHPDQKYLMGVTLDCDTGGTDRTILIERDWNGEFFLVATLTVNANGRHKRPFSWAAVPANQVRIRPDDTCAPWLLYRADWNFQPEPPRISKIDIYFENAWDQYYTGVDLEIDTEGQEKTFVVEVDGVPVVNPATGGTTFPVTTAGRRVVHLTLTWGRGHIFRLYATDDFVGLLFSHRWHLETEPTEQANWTSPFTILGTQADKWLKGVIMEVDTFGQTKTVQVQADETNVLTSFTVNTSGRRVVQKAFPQVLGRVFRFFPIDQNRSRLYSIRPIFDEEPFALERWETQELDHGMRGFHVLIDAMITLKSSEVVTLTITTYLNQLGTQIVQDVYTIPSTGGVKDKKFVPFGSASVGARKGVLYKYVFTCPGPFWLYQEESQVRVQDWQGGTPVVRQPFGNSDVDPTRRMVNPTAAAARDGGGS